MAWNKSSFLELGSYDTAPGSARWHVRNLLREWELERHEELAELIVSELVTNSVLAARARPWAEVPPVRLWLLADSSRVLLLVWDALTDMPLPRRAGDDEENGRGLFLVQQLSSAWGNYRPPADYAPEHDGGKVTWVIIGTGEGEKAMSALRCQCGYQSSDELDFLDHRQEVFIPLDGMAPDGRLHDEGQSTLACLCGFHSTTADELDAHFLAVFTPADRIGLDGRQHATP